jgi:hypothetical protein
MLILCLPTGCCTVQIEEAEMEAALKKKGSSKSQGLLAAAEEVRHVIDSSDFR